MPNPPKMDPARGHRGRGVVSLPAEGRKGDPPAWPLMGSATEPEASYWAALWATPQAVMWERMGAAITYEVARYCRLAVVCEIIGARPSDHAQATALADRLGLTPKAMRLLLWQITADEVAERRGVQSRNVRARLKAVENG